MLVLKLRLGETVQIGPNVTVRVVKTSGYWIKLGITAPAGMQIDRLDPETLEPTEKSGATTNSAA
jgi:carbon storage regulator CsrA